MSQPSIPALFACFGSRSSAEAMTTIGAIFGGALLFLIGLTWAAWKLASHGWDSRSTWAGKIELGFGSTLLTATTGVWAWIATAALGLQ